jgi:multiple sugar transport system permease protein
MKNTSAMVDPTLIYKRLLTYAALLLLAYIFLFPLIFMIMSSFKPEQQIFTDLF